MSRELNQTESYILAYNVIAALTPVISYGGTKNEPKTGKPCLVVTVGGLNLIKHPSD